MAALHLILSAGGLAGAQSVAAMEDSLVLMQDGVYLAAVPTPALPEDIRYLQPDAAARGLLDSGGMAGAPIDYAGLVELVVQHQPVITWT